MKKKHRTRDWLLFTSTVAVVFVLGLLASSIMERRCETAYVYKPQVAINDWEPRNEVWGKTTPENISHT